MVITELIGGLGNQMFQYATARAIATKYASLVKLDVTPFRTSYTLHAYALGHLSIQETFATPAEINRLTAPSRLARVVNRALLPFPMLRRVVRKEKQLFVYDPLVAEPFGTLYLSGYWQNERYFREIAPALRAEFRLKTPPTQVSEQVADQIRAVNAVCVHVRRADYVTNSNTTAWHGICGLDYYTAALTRLKAHVAAPHFFVFSDDAEWARANLQFDDPVTFVSHNRADRNYEDLWLMNLCQHHVVANSSFSWWGAWLASNPRQLVIAPGQWVAAPDVDASGIVPEGWYTV